MSALTDPWIPRGSLSEAHLTATATSTSASSTFVDVTGTVSTNNATAATGTLQVVVGVVAGRRYRVGAGANLSTDTAGDVGGIRAIATLSGGAAGSFVGLLAGASNVDLRTTSFFSIGEIPGYFYCTTSGLLAVKMQFRQASGTGTISVSGGSSIEIRDDGLAPPP